MRVYQRHRLGQRLRQHAVGKAQRAVFAQRAGVHQVQRHSGELLQRAFKLAGHGGHVFGQRELQAAAHFGQYLGQFVEPAQAAQVHGAAELVKRYGRQVVAFVKNHQAVVQLGQGLHAQRRQHQVVVGDDDIGLGQLGACLVVAAFAVARAVAGGAAVAFGGYGGPVAGLGGVVQAVAVAVPAAIGQQIGHVVIQAQAALFLRLVGGAALGALLFFKQVFVYAAHAHQALELELAHIAAPALGQRIRKRLVHGCGQRGQVFLHKLLLQRHGGGRYQYPGLALQRHGYRRAGIGRGLAHAGARLDDGNCFRRVVALAQVGAAQGVGHALRHGVLAGARAKARGVAHHVLKSGQGVLGKRGQGGFRSQTGGSLKNGGLGLAGGAALGGAPRRVRGRAFEYKGWAGAGLRLAAPFVCGKRLACCPSRLKTRDERTAGCQNPGRRQCGLSSLAS